MLFNAIKIPPLIMLSHQTWNTIWETCSMKYSIIQSHFDGYWTSDSEHHYTIVKANVEKLPRIKPREHLIIIENFYNFPVAGSI